MGTIRCGRRWVYRQRSGKKSYCNIKAFKPLHRFISLTSLCYSNAVSTLPFLQFLHSGYGAETGGEGKPLYFQFQTIECSNSGDSSLIKLFSVLFLNKTAKLGLKWRIVFGRMQCPREGGNGRRQKLRRSWGDLAQRLSSGAAAIKI